MGAIKGTNNQGGRKLKPTISGSRQHREKVNALLEANKNLDSLPINPPKYLGYFGKQMWEFIVPILNEVGFVKNIDRTTVEILCVSYENYRKAYNELKKGDLVTVGRKNPLINIITDSSNTMIKCSRDLGLTYSSRAEMAGNNKQTDVETGKEADPMRMFKILAGGKDD